MQLASCHVKSHQIIEKSYKKQKQAARDSHILSSSLYVLRTEFTFLCLLPLDPVGGWLVPWANIFVFSVSSGDRQGLPVPFQCHMDFYGWKVLPFVQMWYWNKFQPIFLVEMKNSWPPSRFHKLSLYFPLVTVKYIFSSVCLQSYLVRPPKYAYIFTHITQTFYTMTLLFI